MISVQPGDRVILARGGWQNHPCCRWPRVEDGPDKRLLIGKVATVERMTTLGDFSYVFIDLKSVGITDTTCRCTWPLEYLDLYLPEEPYDSIDRFSILED